MDKRHLRMLVLASCLALCLLTVTYGTVAKVRATASPKLAITFDDGYLSTYNLAYPYLDDLDIPATVAIASFNVSSTFEGMTMLSWEQIEELSNAGWCIASHGTGTQVATGTTFGGYGLNSTEKIILDEFNGTATDAFETNLGFTPSVHVYAWGNHQNATVRMYIANYYDNAWSGYLFGNMYDDWDIIDLSNDTQLEGMQYRAPRFVVDGIYANKTNEEATIAKNEAFIDRLVANGSDFAGALVFHHLTDTPRGGAYSDITPYVFVETVAYAREQGVDFVTLEDLDTYFGSGIGGSVMDTVDQWIPAILSLTMVSVAFGFIHKFTD